MRLLLSSAVALVLGLSLACSEDAKDASSAEGGLSGSGSGGRAGAGGGPPGAGGYDPALALQCGVDAGSNECRVCLAVRCCNAAKACFGDAACTAAFTPYQVCTNDPSVSDKSGCYSAFGLAIRPDGARTHEPLLLCILSDCTGCGAPQIL